MKNLKNKEGIIFGRLSELIKEETPWGEQAVIFSNWSKLNLKGVFLKLRKEIRYGQLSGGNKESILIVEDGCGKILYKTQEINLKKGYAIKIFPEHDPRIIPEKELLLTCVQKPVETKNLVLHLDKMGKVLVVDPEEITSTVYEYETLGQEIFTCDYENGLGLIKFVFPIDKIPLHQHPFAGRLIRTIWGQGYTYVEPDKYEMNSDTFALFSKGVTHTNGPDPGYIFAVWAFQLPWIESKIDSDNIAGSEEFVKYLGPQIPRELWKTKEDFLRAIKSMSKEKVPD